MKLRNKKTGEIVDVESLGHAESLKEKYGYQVTLSWKTKYENLSQCKSYESLAELNEDWEDYKPTEPLIKGEKVRKAVRAWAEANGETMAKVKGACLVTVFKGLHRQLDLELNCSWTRDGVYTIEELCGTPEPIEPTFIDLDERIKEKEEE